jgi:hypothetical protein
LDEIPCGNFIGHYSVAREQKAWLLRGRCPLTLLAAQAESACGAAA